MNPAKSEEAGTRNGENLIAMMEGVTERLIDATGVYPHHAVVRLADGRLSLLTLDVEPVQVFALMKRAIQEGATEIVFGLIDLRSRIRARRWAMW